MENKRAEAGLVVGTPVDIMGKAAEAQAAKAAIITVFLTNIFGVMRLYNVVRFR